MNSILTLNLAVNHITQSFS